MDGKVDSHSRNEYDMALSQELSRMDCSQLLLQTAADSSSIRGVALPHGKFPEQYLVAELRDFVAAGGGEYP